MAEAATAKIAEKDAEVPFRIQFAHASTPVGDATRKLQQLAADTNEMVFEMGLESQKDPSDPFSCDWRKVLQAFEQMYSDQAR
eukprot:176254-Rhodomonas_salina.1